MVMTTIQSNQLYLPDGLAAKFMGRTFEILETNEGLLLRPVEDVIRRARGCLKGLGLSSQRFLQLKQAEKELER